LQASLLAARVDVGGARRATRDDRQAGLDLWAGRMLKRFFWSWCGAALSCLLAWPIGALAQTGPAAGAAATQNAELAEQVRALQRTAKELRDSQRILQDRLAASGQDLSRVSAQLAQGNKTVESLGSEVSGVSRDMQGLTRKTDGALVDQQKRILAVEGNVGINTVHLDRFWLLIAAALVFFMQAGFMCLEVGMVRRQHGDTQAMKNLVTWLVLSACFFLVGFGLMFGRSYSGLVGTELFAPTLKTMQEANPKFGIEFFLFQLAFAGTSATIVSGAMAERTGLVAYAFVALFAGTLVYPVIGHWIWGTDFHAPNQNDGVATGWLKQLGFIDFAGSTVVHSVGAWISLVGVWFIGPRLKRFAADGTVNTSKYSGHMLSYSTLGVLILWLGWWGFNGGSQLRYDLNVSSIILNTNIAPAFGGLVAFAHAMWRDPENSYEKMLGGVLGGLVAITASCNIVDSMQAAVIGASAGIIHNLAFDLLMKLRLDDPVGAIPVHGACGVWGTLCVALFGTLGVSPMKQLGIQALGIVTVFVAVVVVSVPFFWLLRKFIGLRVSARDEEDGYVVGKTAQRQRGNAMSAPL
jgi:Amt family ammonium transporter